MTAKTLRKIEVLLPLMLLLASCATVEPVPRQQDVPLVGSQGQLDPVRRERLLAQITAQSDSEVVPVLLDEIAGLSASPLYLDNDVELLIDGPATYQSMISEIEAAQRHVLVESYIFSDDDVGQMFSRQLIRKSRQGVDVRVIYDSFGSLLSGSSFFEEMDAAGVVLIEFNSVNPLRLEDPLDFNNRDHRKILVVDGSVAFTGGINFSSTYSASSNWPSAKDPRTSGWRDTHIAIRGPAAVGFQALFLKNWEALGGAMGTAVHAPDAFNTTGSEIVAVLSAKGGDKVQSEIFEAYLKAIEVARERVWITQAYFAPDKQFIAHLQAAALRGVDVRVLVPGVSDSRLVLNASRSRYDDLLVAGVRVFERQDALLHAKTAVIDGIWATVGSSNLDNRSFLHNDEVNAIVLGREFAEQMEAQYLQDERASRRITLVEWRERSLWKRLKEKLSWFVEYWI